ncbi:MULTISPECIES: leucyl aminopeptidase [unclassified Streptomyces]|uniref:leucyl aminopeptidase n=1 Tax=unclassified Streptomyces TaxID=2593676 RepID=UPI0022B65766|nr:MULTISPECIES: leucyl aminopeptidase [unclassified Streptomyces]MCZ7413881.1 leucyl aminopeptidase [Streptomyces sp. WMMC897]MCZ7430877.1 leucyl aminopeptidase [Streptomyces sp. WMMC1477]
MTALTLSTSSAATTRADAIVIGIAKSADDSGTPAITPGAETVDQAFGGRLATVLETLGASGGEGETTKLPAPDGLKAPVVLAVGLGSAPEDGADFAPETLRRAAGAAARALTGTRKAAFALPVEDGVESVAAVAEGALLGAYAFTAYRGEQEGRGAGAKSAKGAKTGKGDDAGAPLAEVTLLGGKPRDKAHKAAVERAVVLAEEVARARDLINTPPNDLHPASFAAQAQAAGKEHGLKVEVLDEKALAKGGYGGILGVGQGSDSPPRLVKLSYTYGKSAKTLALVGKGITYDSGGISLKPAGHNETMKCDMSGAAAVFAAVVAAARLGLAVNVTGWLALAENMPSGNALRPGDVLTMYSGKTVEVLNTDAEGRLVLADALTRACEESPDGLVDVATLTGAMVLALGNRTFGVMSSDEAFRTEVHETAEEAGEQSWPMPMPPELRKGMDSTVADIANMGERMGGGLVAGLFLKEFVSEGTPWAHLDIAGPAFNESAPFGYTPKGGTGSAVRTLLRLAERTADGELL